MESVEVAQLREGPEVFKIKPESLKDLSTKRNDAVWF